MTHQRKTATRMERGRRRWWIRSLRGGFDRYGVVNQSRRWDVVSPSLSCPPLVWMVVGPSSGVTAIWWRRQPDHVGSRSRHQVHSLGFWHKKAPSGGANSLMGLGRVELPTSRLSGVRSNHLSYRPGRDLKIYPLTDDESTTAPLAESRVVMRTPASSVRCTGHRSAISARRTRCSPVSGPDSSRVRSM